MSRTRTVQFGAAAETMTEDAVSPGLLTPATDIPPSKIGSLSSLLTTGVAFVDNSGSTSGSILRNCSAFTQDLAPRYTALWNSRFCADCPVPPSGIFNDRCDDLALTGDVNWTSMGGTSPSTIYAKYPDLPTVAGFPTVTSFTLLTDGQVPSSEVRTRPPLTHTHTAHSHCAMTQHTHIAHQWSHCTLTQLNDTTHSRSSPTHSTDTAPLESDHAWWYRWSGWLHT